MARAAVLTIETGDYVRLAQREQPHTYPADAWWEVVTVDERGLDCRYWHGGFVVASRAGVAPGDVLAHRRPDHDEAA